MIAPGVEQPVVRQLPHPQMKRHGPSLQEILNSGRDPQLGFLHHVGRIEPSLKPWIEPHFQESEKPRPIAGQQFVECLAVSLPHALQQAARLCRVGLDLIHSGLRGVTPGNVTDVTGWYEKKPWAYMVVRDCAVGRDAERSSV